jgi:hypothetical protein
MELSPIPENLKEWKPDTINELIKFPDVESEKFDFKSDISNDLHEHICAMANTEGGFLVLGISEKRSQDGQEILGFKKEGYKLGKQDGINLQIGNAILNIEPNPKVQIENVKDDEIFFPVLKITNEITKKPFMIKNKGQFFVRIGNSTRPASRSTVLGLYAGGLDKISAVERLYASTNLFKESFLHTVDDLQNATGNWQQKVGILDLAFIKNAIISAQWFLEEHDLLGKRLPQGYTMGFNDKLYKLERLNAYIRFYNDQSIPEPKKQMKGQFETWFSGRSDRIDMTEFLDKVMKTATDFLAKFK